MGLLEELDAFLLEELDSLSPVVCWPPPAVLGHSGQCYR